jgi:hypothetical protein
MIDLSFRPAGLGVRIMDVVIAHASIFATPWELFSGANRQAGRGVPQRAGEFGRHAMVIGADR